jgi:hypothetical protein
MPPAHASPCLRFPPLCLCHAAAAPPAGAVIEGLLEEIVTSPDAVHDVLRRGEANRHYGGTAANANSSRSHTVFRMVLEGKEGDAPLPAGASAAGSPGGSGGSGGGGSVRVSYLNLVDLAGSERQEYAQTSGERLREGGSINKSLSALALVISKLAEASRRGEAAAAVAAAAQQQQQGSGTPGTPGLLSTPRGGGSAAAAALLSAELTAAGGGRAHSPMLTARGGGGGGMHSPSLSLSSGFGSGGGGGGGGASSASSVSSGGAGGALSSSSVAAGAGGGGTPEYVPYRNSKLTRLLRQSLGGNALTAILCTCSPAAGSREETVRAMLLRCAVRRCGFAVISLCGGVVRCCG